MSRFDKHKESRARRRDSKRDAAKRRDFRHGITDLNDWKNQ